MMEGTEQIRIIGPLRAANHELPDDELFFVEVTSAEGSKRSYGAYNKSTFPAVTLSVNRRIIPERLHDIVVAEVDTILEDRKPRRADAAIEN